MNERTRTITLDEPGSLDQVASELAQHLRNHDLVPFLGAGISKERPSCLPLAGQLKDPLRDLLADARRHFLGTESEGDDEWKRFWHQNIPLERVLDHFHHVYGHSALLYLSPLYSSLPNRNHQALARLAAKGMIKTVVTLNFDTLIEQAMSSESVGSRVINTLLDQEYDPDLPTTVQVVKPHGSLPPDTDAAAMAEVLGATLSQVGSGPDPRNDKCIRSIFRQHNVLLVAGYSDSDWDIFPILLRHSASIKHVYWFKHNAHEKSEYVARWLAERGPTATIIQGNIADVLAEVCVRAQSKRPVESGEETTASLRAADHFPSASKNALVLAYLIDGSRPGSLRRQLLRRLQRDKEIQKDPELRALRLYCLASILHTGRRVRSSMAVNSAAYRSLRQVQRWGTPSLANRRIWIGYEFLCFAKRPRRMSLRQAWLIVCNTAKGVSILLVSSLFQNARGSNADRRRIRHNRTAAIYFIFDLLHTWSSVLLLMGRETVRRWKFIFRFLHHGYQLAGKFGGVWSESEHYWLRDLEVMILGEVPFDKQAAQHRLDERETAYTLTQDNIGIGNVYCYGALLRYSSTDAETEEIKGLLDKAWKAWSRPDNWTPSGRYRVTLFRCYMGIISKDEAKQILFQNS